MTAPLILTLSCEDRPGIVSRVTGFLADFGGNILEAQQFDDTESGRFFMRVVFDHGSTPIELLRGGFGNLAQQFGMTWSMRDTAVRAKVLLLVSKFDHCLGDLLYRWTWSASSATTRRKRCDCR
jgi:formyltetrahydrofolate deformylase